MKSDSLFIYKSKDQNPKDQNHNTKTLADINNYNIPLSDINKYNILNAITILYLTLTYL